MSLEDGVGLGGDLWGDALEDQDHLTELVGALCEFELKGGEGATQIFFVELGYLAGDAGLAVAKDGADIVEFFGDTVWGDVKDDGEGKISKRGKGLFAASRSVGEKAEEEKAVGGEAACDKCGDRGGRTGQCDHRDSGEDGILDEQITRVGYPGHTGFADVGDAFALFTGVDQCGSAGRFIVSVHGGKRLL